ncbi:hypothetical protein D3C80_1670650 [compost metagenome]
MRPGEEEQNETNQCPDGQAHHPWGVLDQCLAHLGKWRVAEFVTAAEVAAQGLMRAAC